MKFNSRIEVKLLQGTVIIISILFLLSACAPGRPLVKPVTTVKPLGDSAQVTDGSLIYGLPMTVFNITVEFEQVIEKPGPYAKYAADLLGLNDVITNENEFWSMNKITVESGEELDPSEFYIIESNAVIRTNALSVREYGLILDINPEIYRNSGTNPVLSGSLTDRIKFNDLGADEYFINQSDTVYRTVKLDTAFIRIPYIVEKKKFLTLDQLAEKAAKTLLELRDGKQMILTGEANVFPQSAAGIDELNRLEREYLALFTGKSVRERKTVTYTFIPRKEMSGKPITLFRFSDATGPAASEKGRGSPVSVLLEPAKKLKDLTIVPRVSPEGVPSVDYDKLYYRVPDVVNVTISYDGTNYYEGRKLIYQFGQVVQLPANYIIGK